MNDTLRAARPKSMPKNPPEIGGKTTPDEVGTNQRTVSSDEFPAENRINQEIVEPRRGPGRPPKLDPLTAMQTIASNLRHFDSDERRKILETLLALT